MVQTTDAFSEAAFDDAVDRSWFRFRCELGDRLDQMRPDRPMVVLSLWTEIFGPQPSITFTHTGHHRLRLTVEDRDLYPFPPESIARRGLLEAAGWRGLRDQTSIIEFPRRSVDAAAMAAQRALRDVWGVPGPAFLVSNEADLLRLFVSEKAPRREPRLRP
ncbi:TY-Chap domain-containing protein [Gordonia shandongensis]|uniref:TY-Chap domain-containing protein n=1 Tax=Gordonia shandongensis TaxID=376351 RepID=UPI000424ABEA|nr:hypothetical protein [Gordonia shandongensis]